MATLSEQRKRIREQLDVLKDFSNTAAVKRLRQELTRKLDLLDVKARQGRQTRLPIAKRARQKAANAVRAAKMRKHHNYVRQIVARYPDLKYADVRRQLKERREGKQTKIPDVIWRNPSP